MRQYDPWFNYRSARLLALPPAGMSIVEGIYNFWNWFDQASWYPLGRIVGSTVYPGMFLMRFVPLIVGVSVIQALDVHFSVG